MANIVYSQFKVHQIVILNTWITRAREKNFTVVSVQTPFQIIKNNEELLEFSTMLIKLKKGAMTMYVVIKPTGESKVIKF